MLLRAVARLQLACFSVCGALQLAPSPVEAFSLRGKRLYVKRDDKCCLPSGVSGNKARKLASLDAAVPLARVIGSFGGSQSNAMAALAMVAHAHGSRFVYFTKPVPKWLRAAPSGNLARALSLGAELVELAPSEYSALFEEHGTLLPACAPRPPATLLDDGALWVPQGGAAPSAEAGVAALARELVEWWENSAPSRELDVVVPSGTGTTALFLARHLAARAEMRVWAVPCVGDGAYLRAQMRALDLATGGDGAALPRTLTSPSSEKPPRFGALSREALAVWSECGRADLPVDLLYAPLAIRVVLETLLSDSDARGEADRATVYLHTGGLEGVESQLNRYRRAGFLE